MRALLLAIAVLASGTAFARQPADFVAPRELTAEEIEAEKLRSRSSLGGYAKDIPTEGPAWPWRAMVLMGIVFVVVSPFAWRAYKNTASELTASGPGAAPPPDPDADDRA